MHKIVRSCTQLLTTGLTRNVSCTSQLSIDQKWREENGLPENPNAFGPLTNLPDYTFLDGRPTPMGSNQKRRIVRQQEIASKIVVLSQELDMAKNRYKQQQMEQQEQRQKIMQSKLKPKGKYLLEKQK